MKQSALLLAASLLTLQAAAQDASGTIAATLDGAERVWTVLPEDAGGQSWWTATGPVIGVGLWAAPEGSAGPIEDVLDLTLSAVQQGGTTVLAGSELRLLTSDLTVYYHATEDDLMLEITDLEAGEAGLSVSGSFSGRLARTTFSDGAEVADPDDTREIEGTFEAFLPAE